VLHSVASPEPISTNLRSVVPMIEKIRSRMPSSPFCEYRRNSDHASSPATCGATSSPPSVWFSGRRHVPAGRGACSCP
jgi:hypothetical protein